MVFLFEITGLFYPNNPIPRAPCIRAKIERVYFCTASCVSLCSQLTPLFPPLFPREEKTRRGHLYSEEPLEPLDLSCHLVTTLVTNCKIWTGEWSSVFISPKPIMSQELMYGNGNSLSPLESRHLTYRFTAPPSRNFFRKCYMPLLYGHDAPSTPVPATTTLALPDDSPGPFVLLVSCVAVSHICNCWRQVLKCKALWTCVPLVSA